MYQIKIIDTYNEVYTIPFKHYEYANLMELIINNLYDDIGACLGRGLCGTCHVKLMSDHNMQPADVHETHTLSKIDGTNETSRLACQIMLNKNINNLTFKIITDNS